MKRPISFSLATIGLLTLSTCSFAFTNPIPVSAATHRAASRRVPILKKQSVKNVPAHAVITSTLLDSSTPSFVPSPSTTTQEMSDLSAQIPSHIDIQALNQYWLDRINTLRTQKGLRLLVQDERFVKTATEWSEHMKDLGKATHERSNVWSMHQWFDAKSLDFTDRNTVGGWKANYFSENIAWGYIDNSLASATSSLERTLQMMLRERASNGPHYRTIYHADWNVLGAAFAFKAVGKGRYQMFSTFHYGSLKQARQPINP